MIVVDFNQTAISNLMMEVGGRNDVEIQVPLLRHMILNSIRSYKQKFGKEYGELVIACDNQNYWRREYFQYYKAGRKKAREDSGFDWKTIFEALNLIRSEIDVFFPYKVVQKKYVKPDISPEKYIFEHIIRGDKGDGVPNVLSADDSIVNNVRQKPIRQDKIDVWYKDFEAMPKDSDFIKNYERNKKLVSFDSIPDKIKNAIINSYVEKPQKDKSKLLNFFIEHKMKNMLELIEEF